MNKKWFKVHGLRYRAKDSLKEEMILAVPGVGFDGPGYFRLSYAVPDATITGSMVGFRRALEKV